MLFKSEYGDEFAAVLDLEVGKHWFSKMILKIFSVCSLERLQNFHSNDEQVNK